MYSMLLLFLGLKFVMMLLNKYMFVVELLVVVSLMVLRLLRFFCCVVLFVWMMIDD